MTPPTASEARGSAAPAAAAGVSAPATAAQVRAVALTAVTLACFAANSLLCRAALASHRIDPASFTAVRMASGAITLAAIVAVRGGSARAGSWVSAGAIFAYAAAFSFAYVRIHAGTGALLLFGAVQATMIGWAIVRGARPTSRQWVGLLVATLGLAWLVAPGVERPDLTGAGLMLVAGSAWGCYSMRARGSASDPIAANAGNFVRSLPFAGALLLVAGPITVTGPGAMLAAASGAVASAVGYCLWYAVLPVLGATRAAVVQLAVPVIAAVGAVLLLGEVVTARLAVSAVAVLGGIALVVVAPVRRQS